MRVVKREYANVINEYSIEINADYISKLKTYFERITVKPELIPEITEEMVAKVYMDPEKYAPLEMDFHIIGDETKVYHYDFYQFLSDIIDEDLWDSEYECIGSECFDMESYVYE